MVRREAAQDVPDIPDKAHVEHPIRLVHHHRLNGLEAVYALLQIIDKAPGGPHQDVHLLAQGVPLFVVVDPPIDGEDIQAGELSQQPGVFIDLHRKLPGRRDDDGPGERRCGHPATAKETREAGDEEGCRLPGPGLRLPGDIFPCEDEG